MYLVRGAKNIYAQVTTDTAKIKTKAWLYGVLAGVCLFSFIQTLAGV